MYIKNSIGAITFFYVFIYNYYISITLVIAIMIPPVDNRAKFQIFKSFQETAKSKGIVSTIKQVRHPVTEEPDTAAKVLISAGSVAGTLIPLILFAKKQKLNVKSFSEIFKLDYGLKEMVGVSAGSIFGGVGTGLIVDKASDKKKKLDEGVFQFMNATVPPVIVAGLLKLTEVSEMLNQKSVKAVMVIAGILSGMHLSAKLANFVNDPKDKIPDRKLSMKDSIINIDDALGALVLAKFSFAEKIHLNKILPAIYAWCGYRAGESN